MSVFFDHKGRLLNSSGKVVGKIYAPGLVLSEITEFLPASSKSLLVQDHIDKTPAQLAEQVRFLSTVPQPVQRSKQWHKMRHENLTASDLAGAIGESKYEKPFDILEKKCDHGRPFTGNAITQWGVKYEPVATELYEIKNKIDVIEFGLLPHPTIPFLAASPDGITPTGRMLEIKCPPKRTITGIVPRHYWVQMQLQLEVCDLAICDFEECKFEEYRSPKDFEYDSSGQDDMLTTNNMQKGILVELYDQVEGEPVYHYCSQRLDYKASMKWARDTTNRFNCVPPDVRYRYEKTTYWKLVQYSCVVVHRDREWFDTMFPKMKAFWREVCYYRTQPAEILYRDHDRSPPFYETFFEEEDMLPEPSAVSFLAYSDDENEQHNKSKPSLTNRMRSLSLSKKKQVQPFKFLSDTDDD